MIRKLWVRGFRNLVADPLSFSDQKGTLVYGLNNQGKTSLLEAIYILTNGVSPIQSDLEKTICKQAQEAILGADFVIDEDFFRLYLRYQHNKKRDIIINDKPIKQLKQLQQLFHTEFISADILHVFQKEADYRRRDLDRFCSTYFDNYKSLISQYDQVLKQKNKLLKTDSDLSLLDVYNEKLVNLSSSIYSFRVESLSLITTQLMTYFSDLNLTDFADITCIYHIYGLDSDVVTVDYPVFLAEKFSSNRQRELAIGYSCYGAHRDDFSVLIQHQSCFDFYSRGINRMVAILYQLAKVDLLDKKFNQSGLLLLDDTFAEIDHINRRLLLTFLMNKSQLIYTTISDQDRDLFADGHIFEITNGALRRGAS